MVRTDDANFARRVLIAALIVVTLVAMWLLSSLILLIFGAVLVSITLRTLADPLRGLGLSDGVRVTITLLLVAVASIALAIFFGAEFAQQIEGLTKRFSSSLERAMATLSLQKVEEMINGTDIAAAVPKVVSWSITAGQAVLGAGLVIVGGIYLALNPKPYRDGLLALVPPSFQANATATVDDIGEALHRWLGGMLIAMVLVGALTTVALWLAGVQSPLALGLLAGLANFVPYIGSIVAGVVTLIIAAAQGMEIFVWAAGAMFLVQQLESNVITPLVVGRSVSIPPATGLFAIVAMAIIFGPLGALLGFPLTIVIDIAIRRLYVRDTLDKPVEILGECAERSEEAVPTDEDGQVRAR